MKIDFLVGENTYGSTVHFAKAFAKALKRLGVQTTLHWIADGHFFHAVNQISQNPPDLTCSFSDIHLDGKPIADMWQIPHLSLLIDPAIYFLHQLKGNYSWVSCVDMGDVNFIRALNFKKVFYLPHAGDSDLVTTPKKNRPYEVVFFGSCAPFETEDEMVIGAAKKVLCPDGISILQSLIDLGIPDSKLPHYHAEVDHYVRNKDRVELLRSLNRHQVHIWGNGPWKKYVPQAIIHPPVSFDQTLEIMKEAKVVANSSPRFKQGLHERIVYGAICGAAVLSANLGAYTYRYGQWEDMSFDHWEKQAAKFQATVLKEHTWDHRAKTLLSHFH